MKSSKIEVDIVSDTDILQMLLLLMIVIMIIILLLVLLLLAAITNESDNNFDNYNNVIIMKIIITIEMKSGSALKQKKIKSSYIYIVCPISYSVKECSLTLFL